MNVHDEYDNLESVEEMVESEKILAEKEQKRYDAVMLDISLAIRDRNTRVLIREIFKDCGLYNTVNVSTESTLHAEGRRFVGVLLKTRLDNIDPKIYFELMSEGVDYEKAVLERK